MVNFKLSEVIKIVNGRLIKGDPELIVSGVSTDSRKIKRGDLFLAIKGERFDGHQFLSDAVNAGAAALLVMDDTNWSGETPVIKTDDTLKAFGAIARFHRQRFKTPVIGITGSNGKTTTKDLVAAVLSQKYNVVKTEANYNNEIGLPLTLLEMDQNTQAVVVEMGMRGLGQIRNLATIAEPEIGVITNIGQAHLELLGSEANIAKAKSELIESLPPNGIAVLNGDDPWIRRMVIPDQARSIWFGLEDSNLDYRAVEIGNSGEGIRFQVEENGVGFKLFLPLPGRLNVYNALAAVAVGRILGLSFQEIGKGLAEPIMTGGRLKILNRNQLRIIDDTYNASPVSVKAALEVLCGFPGPGKKIAVLADMLELGEAAIDLHFEIGEYAANLGVNHLLAYGDLARNYAQGFTGITPGKAEYFSNKTELIRALKEVARPGDSILIKGSRGMKMEEIVEAI
jgi:UDP-N-acetylmuramoyl-tripeptide--D-alanyl-D-alanine ligase